MIIGEKWNREGTLGYCVWHDSRCLFGEGTRGPGMRAAGSLCSPLMPVDLLWRSARCREVGMFWCDFEGNGGSLRPWELAEARNVLATILKIFWWLLPVGDLGLRYRLSQLLGVRRLTCFWSDERFSLLSGMLTSFLQVQRPCIQLVQTFFFLNIPSQHIVQPNYIYVGKGMPLSDFVQYFNA